MNKQSLVFWCAPIGDSSVDFLYYFATVANETHPGLARVEGSPVAGVFFLVSLNQWCISQAGCIQQNCLVPVVLGVPTFLVLTVTGLGQDEEASFSHVTLLGANGETLQWVKLNSSSSSSSYSMEELVGWVDSVPRVPFSLRLTGQDSRGNKLERVSTEMVQPTHIKMQVVLILLVMNCPLLLLTY